MIATAKELFKSEYRAARLYARREMLVDGVAMVKPDPRKAGLVQILAPTDNGAAYRAAQTAHFNRSAKDKLPSKFETVFFAAIDKADVYMRSFAEVFGPVTAKDLYTERRAA